jgi:ribosomal protein S18 acetylase RimI-like enzyme
MNVALIREIETFAAHAWPAAEVMALDGWSVRFADGVTRRANSVWPNAAREGAISEGLLAQVETFYATRSLPARYQLCPVAQPAELDERLAARGYRVVARTAVQIAELSTILAQTKPLRTQPTFVVEVTEEFDADWFAAYMAVEHADDGQGPARQAILQRIGQPTGYAALRIDNELAAVGLGVLEGGWVGLFCMATAPAFRRRGAASALVRTLAIWAQLYDAAHAYLQVLEENTAALALYERLGFRTLYHYHYREQV